jgi:hypothetical protein
MASNISWSLADASVARCAAAALTYVNNTEAMAAEMAFSSFILRMKLACRDQGESRLTAYFILKCFLNDRFAAALPRMRTSTLGR